MWPSDISPTSTAKKPSPYSLLQLAVQELHSGGPRGVAQLRQGPTQSILRRRIGRSARSIRRSFEPQVGQSCYLPLITQMILLEPNERPTTAQVLDQLNQIQTLLGNSLNEFSLIRSKYIELPLAFKENEAESEEEPDEVAEVPELQPARDDQQQHFSMKTVKVMDVGVLE